MRSRLSNALFGALVPVLLGAQATPTVPLLDPVYHDLDRLIGAGLVDVAIVGQRPFTRREIARLIMEASRTPPRRPMSAASARILERLRVRFAQDLQAFAGETATPRPAVRGWTVELLSLDSPFRGIPGDPVGTVDARINPLLNGRGGARYEEGGNAMASAQASAPLGSRLLFSAVPKLTVGARGTSLPFADASASTLTGTLVWMNTRLEVGRQPLVWGQGFDGGLALSASGRPLDLIRFSSEAPFRAPWIFRWLGPLRGTAVLGDLGPRQNFPHATIAAYKLSGQILPWFELSFHVLGQQGGRGAPRATLLDHVVDLIPPIKYSIEHKNRGQFSNKLSGVEGRVRIPALAGLQFIGDVTLDDADPRRWRSTFLEDAGEMVGLSLQDLGPEGALSAAAEYHHTGLRYFQHSTFTSGLTFNGTLLGDPLGNEGDGGYLRLRWDRGGRHTLRLDLAIERRRGDTWDATSTPPNEDDFHFVLVQSHPAEWRRRAMLEWMRQGGKRWSSLVVGYERVANFAPWEATSAPVPNPPRRLHNLLLGVAVHGTL